MQETNSTPVDSYLASLPSARQRHQAAVALRAIAEALTGCKENVPVVPWSRLHAPHTQTIRAVLADRYDRAEAQRYLSVLQAVLVEAHQLGYLTDEEHRAASELAPIDL